MECGNSDKKKYVTVIIETESVRDNRGIVQVRLNACAISNYLDAHEYTVEPPFNVHQLKIFPHIVFNFSDPKSINSVPDFQPQLLQS
jgi:hypothetical protein